MRKIEIKGEHKFIYIEDKTIDEDGVEAFHNCVISPNSPAIDAETQALKDEHHTQAVIDEYNAKILEKYPFLNQG